MTKATINPKAVVNSAAARATRSSTVNTATASEPSWAAAAALVKRNPAADAALEQRRLQLAIDANVLTDYVRANGMGGVDSSRFAAAIEQLSETYEYKAEPNAALYFTDEYLPASGISLN